MRFTKTHGMSKTALYRLWRAMITRCFNPQYKGYENHGGREISVCREWKDSFESFYADMGDRPSPQHSLERIDNNADYTPGNCRWATRLEQANNKRNNRLLTCNGVTKTVAEWERETGIVSSVIRHRIDRSGVSVERALNPEPLPRPRGYKKKVRA